VKESCWLQCSRQADQSLTYPTLTSVNTHQSASAIEANNRVGEECIDALRLDNTGSLEVPTHQSRRALIHLNCVMTAFNH
jgi:hypothetical protein